MQHLQWEPLQILFETRMSMSGKKPLRPSKPQVQAEKEGAVEGTVDSCRTAGGGACVVSGANKKSI